jgi:hypothetical protein
VKIAHSKFTQIEQIPPDAYLRVVDKGLEILYSENVDRLRRESAELQRILAKYQIELDRTKAALAKLNARRKRCGGRHH